MTDQPSIYDLLAKKSLANIQTEDIHTATSRTFADVASIPFWQGVMMLSTAVETSRTFAYGLPIHTTGTVVSAALADALSSGKNANATHISIQTPHKYDISSVMVVTSLGSILSET